MKTEEKDSRIHGEKAEQGVKKSCDEERKKEFSTRAFVIDIFYVTLCVLVFHADLKALLWGAYVKDHRPPDILPPGSAHRSPHLS